jgi:hypothetical protein
MGPPLDARCLEEEHRLFIQLGFTVRSLFCGERRDEWTKRISLERERKEVISPGVTCYVARTDPAHWLTNEYPEQNRDTTLSGINS